MNIEYIITEPNRQIYTFEYRKYNFKLKVFDSIPRFNGEGIYQVVRLEINNNIIFDENFGQEYALSELMSDKPFIHLDVELFHNDNKNRVFKCMVDSFSSIRIKGDNYDKFIVWLVESLTPIEKKRSEKIKRLQNNIYHT
jgi:hypothetical protein